MTAEIVILNRTAVALAADSIVTLVGGIRRKTYDSAEKIFELSRYQPIALMIYNNAQFMNVPLEVLVRRYRETLTSKQFKLLLQVWPEFEKFLLEFSRNPEDEFEHFRGLVTQEMETLHRMMINHMLAALQKRRRSKADEQSDTFVMRRCRERQVELEASLLSQDFLADVTLDAFSEKYGSILDEIAGKFLKPLEITAELRTGLHAMMFAVIKSNVRSPAFTGFVFAGFGSEELFPTLNAIEVDGLYFGRFRILSTKVVDIDRRGETAAVVPFAQTDMPERFILGIDRDFEISIEKLAGSLVEKIIDQNKRVYRNGVGNLVKELASRTFKDGMESLKKKNADNLNSVVNHLSKKELGEFAYSLVELTSRKRRYSNEIETVGGPIDVAILTRNEGFIWVRRKHYFDMASNPRYVDHQP